MLTYLEKFTLPEEKKPASSAMSSTVKRKRNAGRNGIKVISLSAETFGNAQFKILSGSFRRGAPYRFMRRSGCPAHQQADHQPRPIRRWTERLKPVARFAWILR
jgi:hypothetical protein